MNKVNYFFDGNKSLLEILDNLVYESIIENVESE